jgi:hypothetical protein
MMALFDDAACKFSSFNGYYGKCPTSETEYQELLSDSSRFRIDTTGVFSGTSPTWAEIQTAMQEVQAEKTAAEQVKVSANQKLLALGLSQKEVTALTGYTPTE